MEEPIETDLKGFRLSQKHISFLESIHPNLNEAERICLDKLIKQRGRSRLKSYKGSILIISIALIFFIFSVTTIDNILLSVLTLLFGVFLAVYGILVGVLYIEV